VVHMTCEGSLDMLRYGRDKGFKVMGETCVQYLFFTQDNLAAPGYEGAKFVCSPPMRQPKDQQALWRALSLGLLQVVSTDHCPFYYDGTKPGTIRGKELGEGDFSKIPNGVPGIEDRQGPFVVPAIADVDGDHVGSESAAGHDDRAQAAGVLCARGHDPVTRPELDRPDGKIHRLRRRVADRHRIDLGPDDGGDGAAGLR